MQLHYNYNFSSFFLLLFYPVVHWQAHSLFYFTFIILHPITSLRFFGANFPSSLIHQPLTKIYMVKNLLLPSTQSVCPLENPSNLSSVSKLHFSLNLLYSTKSPFFYFHLHSEAWKVKYCIHFREVRFVKFSISKTIISLGQLQVIVFDALEI